MFKKLIIVGIVILCIFSPLISLKNTNLSIKGEFLKTQTNYYLKAPPEILVKALCSCVNFVNKFGYDFHKHAYQITPNSDKPVVGGLVLTREGKYDHIAVIYKIKSDSILVVESNYSPCRITYRRIALNSKTIKGFIK